MLFSIWWCFRCNPVLKTIVENLKPEIYTGYLYLTRTTSKLPLKLPLHSKAFYSRWLDKKMYGFFVTNIIFITKIILRNYIVHGKILHRKWKIGRMLHGNIKVGKIINRKVILGNEILQENKNLKSKKKIKNKKILFGKVKSRKYKQERYLPGMKFCRKTKNRNVITGEEILQKNNVHLYISYVLFFSNIIILYVLSFFTIPFLHVLPFLWITFLVFIYLIFFFSM